MRESRSRHFKLEACCREWTGDLDLPSLLTISLSLGPKRPLLAPPAAGVAFGLTLVFKLPNLCMKHAL